MSMPDSPERTSPGATVTTSATVIIDAATAWLSPDIHSWGASRETVQRWLEPELGRLDNADFGTQVRDAVGLPVTDPVDVGEPGYRPPSR